MPENTRNTDN